MLARERDGNPTTGNWFSGAVLGEKLEFCLPSPFSILSREVSPTRPVAQVLTFVLSCQLLQYKHLFGCPCRCGVEKFLPFVRFTISK